MIETDIHEAMETQCTGNGACEEEEKYGGPMKAEEYIFEPKKECNFQTP